MEIIGDLWCIQYTISRVYIAFLSVDFFSIYKNTQSITVCTLA